MLKMVVRALVVWAIEVVALLFLTWILPGLVVVDIAAANTAWEGGNASAPKIAMPADMTALITRYDTELKPRLAAIASSVAAMNPPPAYAYAIDALKPLPPVRPALEAGGCQGR